MDNPTFITIAVLLVIFHIIVNAVFSKLIFEREPGLRARVGKLALLWFIPIIGVVIVYRVLNLGWFAKEPGYRNSSSVAMGLVEMDAIFNPGSRHVAEVKQEIKKQVQKSGEMSGNYSGDGHEE